MAFLSRASRGNGTGIGKRGHPGSGSETQLDPDMLRDITRMYTSMPVFKMAFRSFMSMVLAEPPTFSIPAMGLHNNSDMDKLISAYWVPWLRQVYVRIKEVGVCCYYFKKLRVGDDRYHQIPVVPPLDLGTITVVVDAATHELKYKWYWAHGTTPQTDAEATNMYWITSEDHPAANGTICSQLASLLPAYRALLKLQKAQNVAATQSVRPVHVMEYQDKTQTARDDDLTRLVADFGKAAGISHARREQQRNQEIRVRTAELYKQLQETHKTNMGKSTTQPTLWTDTPAEQLEEMDAGFHNRVVALRPGFRYVRAAEPKLVGDYGKAESQFNVMAAAVMDFALELLTPTGAARSQNVEGSTRFETERIKEQSAFFVGILKSALIIAYRDQFRQGMEEARVWRMARIKGDPACIGVFFPELDVQVDLSSSNLADYGELRQMLYDGLITKETMGKHVARARNLPMDQITNLQWPDHVPRELLVKSAATTASASGQKREKSATGESLSASSSSSQPPPKKRSKKDNGGDGAEDKDGSSSKK